MKKMKLFAVWVLLSGMFASCAHGPSLHSFGPYSEAEAFYKKGDYPKAIEKYQEYLTANPQGNLAAIAEYYIAKSYLVSGDKIRARKSFEQVVKRYPKTSWADFALEQIDMLQDTSKV